MPKECFWGRPCDCSECKPDLREKCEICLDKDGVKVGSDLRTDRKGIRDYYFKTYCYSCYQEHIGQYEQAKFEIFKAMVEDQIKNPAKYEPTTDEDIRQDLLRCFRNELKQINFAQSLTPDIVKIAFTLSFKCRIGRLGFELDEMELIKLGDLEEWFVKNVLELLVEKISDQPGPITSLSLGAHCNLKGCQLHRETPTKGKKMRLM